MLAPEWLLEALDAGAQSRACSGMLRQRSRLGELFARNAPDAFWRCVPSPGPEEWQQAIRKAAVGLPGQMADVQLEPEAILEHMLGEGYLGARRWKLSGTMRSFYAIRRYLPAPLVTALRTVHHRRPKSRFPLRWPIEDRYVRFEYSVLAHVLQERGARSIPFVNFWPNGRRYAFVLTHDVDTQAGHDFALRLAAVDQRYGFRSSFNFVPERYNVDLGVLAELRQRGFEIGVHGLYHDGRLFVSREEFQRRAQRINLYIRAWDAVGFRSPLVHRQPEWMQMLEVEYDTSFFDTDPYESMPGGCLSIWPFFVGKFVELPYTLVQDHTLMISLGEHSPRIWLEKLKFIAENAGMALVISHPDYLVDSGRLAVYERFLATVSERGDSWHALPREIARWWRYRSEVEPRPDALPARTPQGERVSWAEFAAPSTIETTQG